MSIKLMKVSVISLLYTILLIFAFIQLIILYLNGQESNQGLTYYFIAILYIIPIHTAFATHINKVEKDQSSPPIMTPFTG